MEFFEKFFEVADDFVLVIVDYLVNWFREIEEEIVKVFVFL